MRHRAIQRWLFTTKDKRPLANVGRDRSQPVGLYRNRFRPKSLKEHVLIAQRIDSNNFKSYGQVTRWEEDGKQYDEQDLKLEICQGSPRLYIFRARDRDLSFDKITYHEKVTQCLFRIGNHPWFLAVAKPTFCVKQFPSSDDIEVFQIEGDLMVKLNAGVWHAGPLFDGTAYLDFINLELSDTNIVDHHTHSYNALGLTFSVQPAREAPDSIW